ncbi:MAG: hypothetical protein MJB14_11635 [Spirochaetes bacterium]|nr:hypothetical protein [Spirochaetota bacterium]
MFKSTFSTYPFFLLFIFVVSFNSLFTDIIHQDQQKDNQQKTIRWNIDNNFLDAIFIEKNVEKTFSAGKPIFYEIQKKRVAIDKDTDLYLSFDKNSAKDYKNNYKFSYSNFFHNENQAVIKESGFFFNDENRIELLGNSQSFFQPGINLDSFTISFWLNPRSYSTNEVILKIGSQYYDEQTDIVEDQSISILFEEGKIFWDFKNMFFSKDDKLEHLRVETYDRINQNQWSHLQFIYNQFSGQLEIYINGIQSALILATKDQSINSPILNMKFHKKNRSLIYLAPQYTGMIDELLISRDVKDISHDKYQVGGSELISHVFRVDNMGAYIKSIDFVDLHPYNSDILYYCRFSDQPFFSDDRFNPEIPWIPFTYNNLKSKSIKYLQWKAILLPGKNNEFSPSLKEIKITYQSDLPPSKPKGLKVIAGNEKVKLKWLINSEKDLKGYKIYYGTKSGNYFGKDAAEGMSPISIGKTNQIEITGLKNNVIYYFTVTAFDDEQMVHESEFSEEVFERPIEVLP